MVEEAFSIKLCINPCRIPTVGRRPATEMRLLKKKIALDFEDRNY